MDFDFLSDEPAVQFKDGIKPRDVKKPLPRFRDWARENLKIASKDGLLVFFELNEIQLQIDDEWELQLSTTGYARIVILKARQMGASAYVQARLYFDVWARENWKAGVMAHDLPGCDFVFERTQTFNEELPEPLRRPQKYGNRREIAFKAPHRSSIRVNVAKGRGGFGRGGTIHAVHLSEVAFWKKIRGQSTSQGQANAIKNSVPRSPGTAVIIESTANGMGGEFYDLYIKAKQKKNDFKALFFPWFAFKEYKLVGRRRDEFFAEQEWQEDEAGLEANGVSEEQLAWRRWAIAMLCDGDLDAFHQEYPSTDVEAFLTSGRPVFLPSLLNRRLMELKRAYEGIHEQGQWIQQPNPPPKFIFNSNGLPQLDKWGEFTVFRHKDGALEDDLVMTVDVAEGIERRVEEKQGDYSIVDVWDRRNNEQIAQYRGHCDPDQLGTLAYLIGRMYGFPRLVVESNNHGRVTIKQLQQLEYPKLYFREVIADAKTMVEVKYTKYGWDTTTKTKPFMIEQLKKLWRERGIIINSLDTVDEHLTYVRIARGMTEAQSGRYDDCVMSAAIFAAWSAYHPYDKLVQAREEVRPPGGQTGADILASFGVGAQRKSWGRRL